MGFLDNWLTCDNPDRKQATGYLVIAILLSVLFILNVGVVEEWSGIDTDVLAGFQALSTFAGALAFYLKAYSCLTKKIQ